MTENYTPKELAAEMAKIREAYSWLEEATIRRYAEQVLKNKHKE